MYSILGFLSVLLLVVVTSPYWFRLLNKHLLHIKGPRPARILKGLRGVHKPLGATLALIALVHGYLAWGSLRLHTGNLAWLFLLVTATLGGAFYQKKKKALLVWHRRAALASAALVLLHLLLPNALMFLFR